MVATFAMPQTNAAGAQSPATTNRKFTYRAERVARWERFYRDDPVLEVLLSDAVNGRYGVNRRAAAVRTLENELWQQWRRLDEGTLYEAKEALTRALFRSPVKEFRRIIDSAVVMIETLLRDRAEAERDQHEYERYVRSIR